ncbi:MAG: LPXTG cell wall anchor domain-containing protein [Ignavibacteria bacterium]|nr:LPXTG cell wall anchor domain-containing protein [Ignavibacteria bacterium]
MEQVTLPTIIAGGFLLLSFIILYIYKNRKRND